MADDLVDPFNELVTTWNPDWLQGTSEAIRQCWVEVKEQFPGDELPLLATEFHKRSVEHAGTSAPTFIELVCMCLAKPLCLIGEKQCSERTRRETLAELMKVDAGFLSAEIGRELSWLVLNRGKGPFMRSHDSDGRLVGVFGLVSVIGETADWIRSMVEVEQTGSPSPVAPAATAIESTGKPSSVVHILVRERQPMTTAVEPTSQPVAVSADDEDQFARYSDPLTALGKRILKSLWNHKFAVQFESLRVEAWEGSEVSVGGIERRLQDIEKRWMEAELTDIDLEISPATTSVKLVKPLTKTGDKKGDN